MAVTTQNKQSIKSFIESSIAKHQVVIFAKSWCSYCHRTKATMNNSDLFQNNVNVQIHELDIMEAGDMIQEELYQMTGQATVPSVWVNGTFLGGNSETQIAMKNGQLSALLRQQHGERVQQ
jgi:glutaredoxin